MSSIFGEPQDRPKPFALYTEILKDSFRVIRTQPLIWVFGIGPLILMFPLSLIHFDEASLLTLLCLYFCSISIGFLIALVLHILMHGGAVFLVHETLCDRTPNFKEIWLKGKSKVFANFGVYLLSAPILIPLLMTFQFASPFGMPPIVFQSLLLMLAVLLSPLFLGVCAVMINDFPFGKAAMTGLYITFKNFLPLLVFHLLFLLLRLIPILFVVLLLNSKLVNNEPSIRIAFDSLGYSKMYAVPAVKWINSIVTIILNPIIVVVLTVGYLKFTHEIAYPALQNPADDLKLTEELPS